MFLPLYVSMAIAGLFDILIPLAILFINERGWAAFRDRLVILANAPLLSYRDLASGFALPVSRRFYGQIEALEGGDRLWVRGPECSAVVDLSHSPFHVMSQEGRVERLSWKQVHSLSEGTRLFIAGALSPESGLPAFRGLPGEPLIAVLFDGPDEDVLPRLLAGGRTRSRLLGRAVLVSAAAGLGIFTLLFMGLSRSGILDSVRFLSILIALSPLLLFMPPGAFSSWLAGRFWLRARDARIWKDIARLPLLDGGVSPPRGSPGAPRIKEGTALALSLFFLAFGYFCNFSLAVIVYRLIVSQ